VSIYSQHKPLYHGDRMDSLRAGISPPPVHVQLILSDLCNQDCHFCAYRMSGGLSTELFGTEKTHNPNRKIPTDKAVEILDDCAAMGVKAVQFTGGGEPTVHAQHLEIIHHAQRLGLKTALVTNGVKLDVTHPSIQALDWLRISVDAGHCDTYCRIRRVTPAHWDRVWANIADLRDFEGNFGVGFVVTNENYEEIPVAAIRCAEAGVPYMRIGAVFSAEGMRFYDSFNDIAEYIDVAKGFETDDFKIVDLFGRRMGDLENHNPDFEFCAYQYFTLYIGADLNVYRCCNTAYTTPGKLVSLKNQRFKDAALGRAPFDARTCRYCQFLGQNRAINAALTEPEDVDFT
jgi:MoaA/NifB/PqqE/SkfB family radical SAM enzyme